MQRADSLEKTLMLGKIEGRRKRGWQRMRWLGGVSNSMDMSLSKLWEIVKDRVTWHAAVHGVTKNWTQLSDWTTKEKFRWQSGTSNWYLKCRQHYETETTRSLWDQMDTVTINCRTPSWYLQNIGAFLGIGKRTHLAPSVKEEIVFVFLSADMVK